MINTFLPKNVESNGVLYIPTYNIITSSILQYRRDLAAQTFGRSAKVLVMKSLGALS